MTFFIKKIKKKRFCAIRKAVSLWGCFVAAAFVTLCVGREAVAKDQPDISFALLRYDGGHWNPRPLGLERLAWEVRRRTSIAIGLNVAAVDPNQAELFAHPFLVWQGDAHFPPLSQMAVTHLRQHLTMGGTIWVDLSDARVDGPFHRAIVRAFNRIMPDRSITRVPQKHVLYQSFFLVTRHGGRVPARSYLEGIFIEKRLAVVITANDLAGAMARDSFGEWTFDVGQGGQATREMSFRLGINILMYALCLDYKEDQVHIPFILKRRR